MLLSSIIEEAMEDGMWVVVSNCDQDKNFWTLINFKLYQLKLEARVSPNYRLFIVMRQSSASIIPKYGLSGWGLLTDISFSSFVLQHSLIVCLEPPSSPQDHVEMLVAAAPDKAETALQVASHHAFIKQANQLLLLSDEDYMVMTQFRGN